MEFSYSLDRSKNLVTNKDLVATKNLDKIKDDVNAAIRHK